MTRPTERTAAEAFTARRASIDANLERLRRVLEVFDTWHRKAPNDWSVVGDAGAVDTALAAIIVGCEAAEVWQREWSDKAGHAP